MEEQLINRLETNITVFNSLLNNRDKNEYFFKPKPQEWSMIQVLSHLVDEEKFDFRTRVFSVLNNPEEPLPAFDPVMTLESKSFVEEDYNELLDQFMDERIKTVAMLRALEKPNWQNAFQHPKEGPLTAGFFLTNWVAHDIIHIQQLNRLAYQYLKTYAKTELGYAGNFRIG